MNRFFALAALCTIALPSVALAQSAPPPMPQRPNMAGFRQMHDRAERIHRAERTQVLAALTPSHRTLLASIAGNMAIAPNPDRKAAAARLDAALSPAEKSAVLAAHKSAMTQMHDAMHAMMARMPRPQGSAGPHPMWKHRARHTPTAGELVLAITNGEGGPHGMPFMGPPPGMQRYHSGPGMQGPPPAPEPAST
ncbi:MAG: hypothetical protein ACREML_03330 [Vulcanimicrobiaceae bacterium]